MYTITSTCKSYNIKMTSMKAIAIFNFVNVRAHAVLVRVECLLIKYSAYICYNCMLCIILCVSRWSSRSRLLSIGDSDNAYDFNSSAIRIEYS